MWQNTMIQSWVGKDIVHLIARHGDVRTGIPGRTEAETMAESASRLVQAAFLHHPGPYSIAHDGLVPVTSIINKKDAPIDQSNRGIFPVEVPSSQTTLACAQLTETNQTENQPTQFLSLLLQLLALEVKLLEQGTSNSLWSFGAFSVSRIALGVSGMYSYFHSLQSSPPRECFLRPQWIFVVSVNPTNINSTVTTELNV